MPTFTLTDWLFATLPILTVLVLMLAFRRNGAEAGAAGWLVALAVARLRFGAGWEALAYAQIKGLLLTLFVLYVIWGALTFYHVTEEAGAVATIGAGLPRLTSDRGLQALILGWAFSSFLQGLGGFGVPVAVVAPLLVGLGFPPLAAAVIPSIGHSWAVTFGSLGSSFYALMAATGRSGDELAPWSAALLGLACLGCGAATLWAAGGWRTLRAELAPLLLTGVAMAGTQAFIVTRGMWTVGAVLGGLAGLATGIAWARWQSKSGKRPAEDKKQKGMSLGWALAPYAILIAITLTAELIPAVSNMLGRVTIRVQLPALSTARGWIAPAEEERTLNVFGHAGALLTYAALAAYALFHIGGCYTPGAAGRIARGVIKQAWRPSLGTAAMVSMAATMERTGMSYLLADRLARAAGAMFPLLSPFIGALGAFMTGSNVNSNVIFAGLQQHTAALLGISPLIILAAQTAGGAIGSAFAPAKIIVGCSTIKAEEAPVLQTVMRYGMAIVGTLAVITMAAVYLQGRPSR